MADDVKDTTTHQTEGLGDTQDASLGEPSINDLLNEIPSHEDYDEHASAEPVKPAESTKAPLSADDVQRMIRESNEKADERIRELEQTNTYLRGRVEERRDPQPVEDAPKDFSFDETEFADTLQSNAPKAISKLLRDMLKHELGQVTKEVGKTVDERVKLSDAQQRRQAEYNNDIGSVQKDFATELSDQSFKDDCDKELESIIRSRGGDSLKYYQPGDFINAANRVALRRARAGKLQLNGADRETTPATATRPTLREVAQRAPQSDSIGERRVARSGPATTIAELFPDSDKDQRIARKVAKDMGIKEGDWVRSYLRAKDADPDFDRR